MISLSVKELLQVVRGKLVKTVPDFLEKSFVGVSIDSRSLVKGNLFVGISGERNDGHDFVSQAVSRGAAVILIEESKTRKLDQTLLSNVPTIAVTDTRAALQELAGYYRRKFDLPVLAITGSNGKTTTKEMIAQVLETKYEVLKSQRSFNTLIGVPLTIFELSPQTELMVLELGTSQFGEIARLAELSRPTLGLILNIVPAHLETFGTLENVAKAKFELLDELPEKSPVFLNLDDAILRARASSEKHRIISFAWESAADYQAKEVAISDNGHIDFRVKENLVRLNLLGRHNIYNALAAYAVGEYFNVTPQAITQALEAYRPVHLRMEIQVVRGVKIINDCYNANPASMVSALESLQLTSTSGSRIAVLADMLELGDQAAELHSKIGQKVFELGIDYLVTVGELAENIAISALENGMAKSKVKSFKDKVEAGTFLLSLIQPGDTILLKGSRGMKMEELAQRLGAADPGES